MDPPRSGTDSGNIPAGRRKRTGGHSTTRHPIRSDVDGPPLLISEVEINASAMFRDADVDLTFLAIELRSCFQEVER